MEFKKPTEKIQKKKFADKSYQKALKAEVVPTLEFYDQATRQEIISTLARSSCYKSKTKVRNMWRKWIVERPPLYWAKKQAATLGLKEWCRPLLYPSQRRKVVSPRKSRMVQERIAPTAW